MSRKLLLSQLVCLVFFATTSALYAESTNSTWNATSGNGVANTINEAISSAGSGAAGGFLGPNGAIKDSDPLLDPGLINTGRELAEGDGSLNARVRQGMKDIRDEGSKENAEEAKKLLEQGQASKYKGGNPNPGEAAMYRVHDMKEILKDRGIRDECFNPHIVDFFARPDFSPTCCVREGEELWSRQRIETLHPDSPFEYLVESWQPATVAEIGQPMESQRITQAQMKPQEMEVRMLKKMHGAERIEGSIKELQEEEGVNGVLGLGSDAAATINKAEIKKDAEEFSQKVEKEVKDAPFTAPIEDGYFYRAGHAMPATAFTNGMKESLAQSYRFHKDQFKKFEVKEAEPWGTDLGNGAKYIYQPEKNYQLKNPRNEPSNPRKGMEAYAQDKLYCQKMNVGQRTVKWLAKGFDGENEGGGDGSENGFMCAAKNNGPLVPVTDYHQAPDQRTSGSWATAWKAINLAAYDPEMKEKYIPYERRPYTRVYGFPWIWSLGGPRTGKQVPDKIIPVAHEKMKKECTTDPAQYMDSYEKDAKYLDKAEKNFESWVSMRFVRSCPKGYNIWRGGAESAYCQRAGEKLR